MNKNAKIGLRLALAAVCLATSAFAYANECLNESAWQVGKSTSWAIPTQQAANTWDDWIWRGPIFYCTATGKNNCTYAWGQSNTTGYTWSVGLSVSTSNIPVIGKLVPGNASGSYTRQESSTVSYTWSQTISKGYYVQPVNVVRRRWTSGVFQGMDQRTGQSCVLGPSEEASSDGNEYWWNGSATYGYWAGNNEQMTFGQYNVWR